MKYSQKKLFAREFLILVFCILTGLLTFIGTFFWNYYYNTEIESLNTDLELIDDQVFELETQRNQKLDKQKDLFTRFYQSDINNNYYSNYYTFWDKLESINRSDSLSYYWDDWDKETVAFFKENDFENSEQLKEFIQKNSLNDIEKSNYEKIRELLYEEKPFIREIIKEKRSKILDYNKLILKVFFTSLLVLFPIRYLILMTVWSIKMIWSKNDAD